MDSQGKVNPTQINYPLVWNCTQNTVRHSRSHDLGGGNHTNQLGRATSDHGKLLNLPGTLEKVTPNLIKIITHNTMPQNPAGLLGRRQQSGGEDYQRDPQTSPRSVGDNTDRVYPNPKELMSQQTLPLTIPTHQTASWHRDTCTTSASSGKWRGFLFNSHQKCSSSCTQDNYMHPKDKDCNCQGCQGNNPDHPDQAAQAR